MNRMTVVLIALVTGCGTEVHPRTAEATALQTQAVQVAAVREVQQPVGDEVVGTVRARTVTAISSSIMGTVRALKVTLGSQVRAGDVLIQLSAGEIEAKANQAEAMFARAKLELQRAEQLRTSKSISDSQYEQATAQFRVAEAAKAEAEVMRAYTVIRAPFAGVVTSKQCDVGDLALPGKPLLVLESPGALQFEASVPEAIAHYLHRGDVMPVRIDALSRELAGSVSELSPAADAASRTVQVKLDLPQVAELRAGMFGRLVVRTGEQTSLLLPNHAVVQRGQMELAYVVQNKRARLRLIRTGRTHDGETEVLAGLDPGEQVVVQRAHQLVDGQKVELQP